MNKELLRLICAQIFQHSAMAGIRLIAPLLALKFGYSSSAVGLLLSLFALSNILMAFPAGRLADQYGIKKPFIASIIIAIIGTIIALSHQSFLTLCIAAFATGGASGTTIIILQRYAANFTEKPLELKKICGWLSIGPVIAIFIGPLVAGGIIDIVGFKASIATMLASLVIAILLVIFMKQKEQFTPAEKKIAGKNRALSFLKDSNILKLLFIDWLLACCWDVHAFILPVFGYERSLSATTIGTILSLFALTAFLIRLALPYLVIAFNEWQIILTSMISTIIIFSIYPLITSGLAMTICAILLGLSLGAVQPMVMSLLHQMTPADQQGEAVGVRQIIANSSSVSMPLVFGSLGALIGISSIFWVTGVIVSLNIPLALKMQAQKKTVVDKTC